MTGDFREQRIEVNGLNLNTVQWGDPEQPSIVLLHGLRSNAHTWDRLAAELQHRYHVVALDQRGRGASDWDAERRYYTQYYVDDLKQIVDALQLRKFILLGHSMGGSNALVFSEQFPDRLRALIIEDIGPEAGVQSGGTQRTKKELSTMPEKFDSRQSAHSWLNGIRRGLSDEIVQQRVDALLKQAKDGSMHWRFDLEGITQARLNPLPAQTPDLWPALKNASVPVLVLRGEHSDYLDEALVARMQACNSNVTVKSIADATHFVHDDNFSDYWFCLGQFLDALHINT